MRQDHKISRANSAPSERIKSAEQFVKLSRRKISWENCKLAALSGARDKNLAPSYHQHTHTYTDTALKQHKAPWPSERNFLNIILWARTQHTEASEFY